MQVQFQRSGGFAGLLLSANINTDTLPPDEAQQLINEMNSAHFFDLPTQISGKPGAADTFQYVITVQQGGATHTVQADDSALPDNVVPFVRHLEMLAKTKSG